MGVPGVCGLECGLFGFSLCGALEVAAGWIDVRSDGGVCGAAVRIVVDN